MPTRPAPGWGNPPLHHFSGRGGRGAGQPGFLAGQDERHQLPADRHGWHQRAHEGRALGGRHQPLEAIDPAMLRGGRFSEKVLFPNPDAGLLVQALAMWMDTIRIPVDVTMEEAAELLSGLSFPSAREALQTAVNRAIGEEDERITADLLREARSLVAVQTP